MKASRLATGVYADTSGEGKGNIGAIELNTYTLVVDSTISSKTAKAFRRSLQSQVETPLRKLVLTHYHSDHTLGIPVFKDCEIIAAEPYRKLRRTRKHQPTRSFEDSLVLRDGDLTVELVLAGGHTDDSTYVYFPQEKTLFSGDLIFARTFFYAGDPTFNPETWLTALKTFLSKEIDTVIPGHGPVCDKEEISTYAEFFKEVSATVEKLVADRVKKQEVIEYMGFPAFHNEYREGLRELALGNWYEFYKRKTHVQRQE